ncbi:MAG: HAD family phosphatase [Bacteroides sp.]|nr:HAD family phosphatase [Bacteroides sp.]
MLKEQSIKNILFDLGGVILDIDVHATLKGFYELGFPSELLQYPNNMTSDLFFRYETGKIGTKEFRNEIRKITGLDFSDEALDEAWTAMIVRIPEERTLLLEKLKERYDLYMLSNTSPLHAPVFEQMYLEKAGRPMKDLFKEIYYSYEIGWHKPDKEAWEYVINDAGIVPQETLFLDDNIHNIKASQELGFQAIHIHERTRLTDLGFDL